MSLLELFVDVDDFCKNFLPKWRQKLLTDGSKKRLREGQLSLSEIMTIIIYFHQSRYRTFKSYYLEHVCKYLHCEFPGLVSYERFVILMPTAFGPLCAYLKACTETALEYLSSIQQPFQSVITTVPITTRSFQGWPSAEKVRWAGFMA